MIDVPYVIAGPFPSLVGARVLGSHILMAGLAADRPPAGLPGRFYFSTDTAGGSLARDSGSAWVDVAAPVNPLATDLTGDAWQTLYLDGSGLATELALGASGDVLTSNGASSAPSWQTPSVGDTVLRAYATSDQTVTNSASLADDSTLSLSLDAGATYLLTGFFAFSNSSTSAGVRADMGAGTATVTSYGSFNANNNAILTSRTSLFIGNSLASFAFAFAGSIEVNTAGTFGLRFANQSAGSSNTTTRKQGSWLQAVLV